MLTFSSKGMRVIALAYRSAVAGSLPLSKLQDQNSMENRELVECNLTFLGLMAIYDPPRQSSAEAVRLCKGAGTFFT